MRKFHYTLTSTYCFLPTWGNLYNGNWKKQIWYDEKRIGKTFSQTGDVSQRMAIASQLDARPPGHIGQECMFIKMDAPNGWLQSQF